MHPFRVKTIKFVDGERYPLLLDIDTGKPLLMPTIYVTATGRSANLAAKSLEVVLRSIMHLYTWAIIEEIDIETRFSEGRFFEIHEIDAIVREAHYKYDYLLEGMRMKPIDSSKSFRRSFENVRKLNPRRPDFIKGATVATRIRHIRDYLDWLASMSLRGNSGTSVSYQNMQTIREQMTKGFTARLPRARGRNQEHLQQSIDARMLDQILEALSHDSPQNPFDHFDARVRNQLIFLLLYTTGIRRGECLGIKIEDIDFQSNTLLIRRRADDATDPRTDQPNAKTRDRRIPVETAVIDALHNYIIDVRRRLPAAKRHTFLFVTHKAGNHSGMPLSHSGYSKIFRTLRQSFPNIPKNLSGHTLRHIWNENFSRLMDTKGVPEDRERQLRSYLMGWTSSSTMAVNYTKRHVREKANDVMLNLQTKLLNGAHND